MTTTPAWDSVDNYTADLLTLVADTNTPSPAFEWATFLGAINRVAGAHGGHVDQNDMRPLIRGVVKPCRIGAFTNRALSQGLIAYTGEWEVSDDTAGRNSGKPARVMRWIA